MYEMGKAELDAVRRVMKSRKFFRYGGVEVVGFEKEWSALIGSRSTVATTSGTAALIVSLQAMGIGPGDSVLVPAYTFVSTALAVTAVGAIPIYVEVDDTLTLCPADLERKIRRHTACVIPVHMQGMPCNLAAIRRIAKAHGIRILEDCCQALGGRYRGRRLGAWGDMGAYSFNVFKILSCGEGGACVTSDRSYAERAYMAQDGSCSVWPETGPMSEAFFCGGNFRMNEINAAILREQVKRLDRILGSLRETRRALRAGLSLPDGLRLVESNDEAGDCGVCFLIRARDLATAERAEAIFAKRLRVHRPINSGRHVYAAWGVVNSKIGGHHRDWDCFRHPRNQGIRTNYDAPLKQTDAALRETILCQTPYGWSPRKIRSALAVINGELAE
jgi:dTDP-4-amino-4,6-dideoxygalactose transaminase